MVEELIKQRRDDVADDDDGGRTAQRRIKGFNNLDEEKEDVL